MKTDGVKWGTAHICNEHWPNGKRVNFKHLPSIVKPNKNIFKKSWCALFSIDFIPGNFGDVYWSSCFWVKSGLGSYVPVA